MIEIFADTDRLVEGQPAEWVVSQVADYTGAYRRVLEAAQRREDLRLYVQHGTIMTWFENMAGHYPSGTFHFRTIDARDRLAEIWGVSIPANIKPEEIQEAELLTLEIEPAPGMRFEDVLLAHFYDPLFTVKRLPMGNVVGLLEVYDRGAWESNREVQLLNKVYTQCLYAWTEAAGSRDQRELIYQYACDPAALKARLIGFRVLNSYPQMGKRILGEDFHLYRSLGLNLAGLPVDERQIEDVITQVTYLLNEYRIDNPETCDVLLGSVSGLLMVEFETIEKILLTEADWITPERLDELEIKFEALSDRIERRILRLREAIRPQVPTLPEPDWDVGTMLEWALTQYLPYQAWCDRNDTFERELYETGDRFSAWLYNNWYELHTNSGRTLFNVLPNIAARLSAPDRTDLVLVVDNLGWSFQQIIRELLLEGGFQATAQEAYLAMLPTETEISKKCLLSGSVAYTDIDDRRYQSIIEKGWVPFFEDARFRYLPDIGSLSEIESIDAQAYVVNYLAIDRTLHKSDGEFGMRHHEYIRILLEKLVENVVGFIHRHDLKDRIRLHVVSDHGSTRIPREMPNEIDPAYFKARGIQAGSHRYTAVDEALFDSLPDNLKIDCFFLDAGRFGNETPYLVARRANRFRETSADVYVHGGMLPEEVIVPYMAFEFATEAIRDLTVTLLRNEFRYRRETIELEVGNPNDVVVEDILITVINANVEIERQVIDLLDGMTKRRLSCKAAFKQTPNLVEQESLTLRLRFRCRGEVYTQEAINAITMRKMVEEVDTSMFDELG